MLESSLSQADSGNKEIQDHNEPKDKDKKKAVWIICKEANWDCVCSIGIEKARD